MLIQTTKALAGLEGLPDPPAVHPVGTPLVPQAVLGSPNWPWRPIGEHDVAAAIQEVTRRGPRLVAVSSHDSTPWTYDAFAQAFGERYRTLRVGERLEIGPFPSLQTPAPVSTWATTTPGSAADAMLGSGWRARTTNSPTAHREDHLAIALDGLRAPGTIPLPGPRRPPATTNPAGR